MNSTGPMYLKKMVYMYKSKIQEEIPRRGRGSLVFHEVLVEAGEVVPTGFGVARFKRGIGEAGSFSDTTLFLVKGRAKQNGGDGDVVNASVFQSAVHLSTGSLYLFLRLETQSIFMKTDYWFLFRWSCCR